MNDGKQPPPFLVGQKYFDRVGEYTVIATDEDYLTIERPDGCRTIADVVLKARIHRNVVMERGTPAGDRTFRRRKRGEPTRRQKGMMERILQFEADGVDHTGVEIDRLLADVARDLGYYEKNAFKLHPTTGRSMFANDGDWAKARLTAEGFHAVVGTAVHGDMRLKCNVYRITPRGLDELRVALDASVDHPL